MNRARNNFIRIVHLKKSSLIFELWIMAAAASGFYVNFCSKFKQNPWLPISVESIGMDSVSSPLVR
jgi:hypothetical protein